MKHYFFAALAFCKDGDEIVHAKHGFEMYSIITKIVGATSKLIEENKNYTIDVSAILKQVTPSTKIILLNDIPLAVIKLDTRYPTIILIHNILNIAVLFFLVFKFII